MLSTSKAFFRNPSAGGGATDPSFAYVPLLLNTGTTNGQQNNTFLDSSTNNFTITRNGTPTQGSITPYWPNGQWSNYFNGSTDYLSVPSNAAFGLGTGDFTIECWIYLLSVPTQFPNIFFVGNFGAIPTGLFLNFRSSGTIALVDDVNVYASSASPLVANTWYHVAAVRSSGSSRIYVNGVGGTAVAYTGNVAQNNLYIGYAGASSQGYPNAYISNWRLVKGVAVYTGNFTLPTAPLAATQSGNGGTIQAITGTQTSLLTCQSNRFRDNSAQVTPATITVNGTPRVQAFQPFSPTASYTTALYGGSGYFNGSTDYLSAASNAAFAFGSADFTIEFWLYANAIPTSPTIAQLCDTRPASTNGAYILIYLDNDGAIKLWVNSANRITGSVISTRTWYHVALARSSGSTKLFLNGAQTGSTYTDSTVYLAGAPLIGASYSGGPAIANFLSGYLSNFRIVNGTAVYTGAFTPPTAPVTAITNTSLLLNMTNAGIYDAAVQNNAITVGNAQVSTAQSKWSPTSISFNGTTDYLTAPSNVALAFGSADFTIEFWMYATAIPTNPAVAILFDTRPASTQGAYTSIYLNNNGTINLFVNSANRITSSVISTGTWYYVALTRSSGVTKMFLNGTQTGSNYTDSTVYLASAPFVGASYSGGAAITNFLNGYIQDFRITRGVARTITTPTAAFPTR